MNSSLNSPLNTPRLALIALGALALAVFPAPARAQSQLVLLLTPSSAAAGGTGSFEVALLDTDPVDPFGLLPKFSVSAFSFEVTAPAGSGVTFTGADMTTAVSPYIFSGNSFDADNHVSFFGPRYPSTDSSTDLIASDATNDGSNVTVGPSSLFDLGRVTYAVAAGTSPAVVTVSLADIGGGTSFSDSAGNGFAPGQVAPGQITVTPAVTPEPSSLVTLALAGLLTGGLAFKARRVR